MRGRDWRTGEPPVVASVSFLTAHLELQLHRSHLNRRQALVEVLSSTSAGTWAGQDVVHGARVAWARLGKKMQGQASTICHQKGWQKVQARRGSLLLSLHHLIHKTIHNSDLLERLARHSRSTGGIVCTGSSRGLCEPSPISALSSPCGGRVLDPEVSGEQLASSLNRRDDALLWRTRGCA